MKNKLLTYIFLIVLLASIVMSVGTLNVYIKNKIKSENNIKIKVEEVQLLVNYNTGNKIIINSFDNKIDYNYDFSITNESNYYKVNYKVLFITEKYPFNSLNTDFKFNLSALQKQITDEDILISNNGVIPYDEIILGNGTIGPKQTHYYSLNIIYNEKMKSIGNYIGKIQIVKSVE